MPNGNHHRKTSSLDDFINENGAAMEKEKREHAGRRALLVEWVVGFDFCKIQLRANNNRDKSVTLMDNRQHLSFLSQKSPFNPKFWLETRFSP